MMKSSYYNEKAINLLTLSNQISFYTWLNYLKLLVTYERQVKFMDNTNNSPKEETSTEAAAREQARIEREKREQDSVKAEPVQH